MGTTLQHPTLSGFGSYFNDTNACHIQSETIALNNETINAPKPTGSSDESWITSIFGVTRQITVIGTFHEYIDPASVTANDRYLKDFITEMDSWVNDGNPNKKTYTTGFGKEYGVLPRGFSYNYTVESTLKIDFTLILVEGTLIT